MISWRYFAKRLVSYGLTVFASMTLIFLLTRLAPQAPSENVLLFKLDRMGFPGDSHEMREVYLNFFGRGMGKDVWIQYSLWLGRFLQGNWVSPHVRTAIMDRLPWTIGLSIVVILVGWSIGNILGTIVGWQRERSRSNWVLASISIVINQIPFYVLGLLLVMVFAFYLPLFPTSGGINFMRSYSGISLDYIIDIIYHATLPALSVIIVSVGGHLITMRSLIVNVKGEDFVRFAEARGLKKNRIMMRYAFRNALLPSLTGLALSLGSIASGSMIVEWIFSYPGIGTYYIQAIKDSSYDAVQGITLLIIFGVMTATFIIDLLSPIIDPRISHGRK